MLSKTGILYILGFLISVSICSAFGLLSKQTPLPHSIFIFSDRIFDSVIKGNKEKIISFINKGGNINKKNIHGYALLHYAIMKRNAEILIILIINQANIDIKDRKGNTPLHLAASYGYFDVVKLLLENGARVDIRNNKNQTPLKMLRENYFSTFSQETKNDIINLLRDYEAR
jgi:hypothetical protein